MALRILSISSPFYLEYLSILIFFPAPLNISTKYALTFSLYLEQKVRSHCNYSFPILNFLLAYSVIKVSYRVSYGNTIESLQFNHPRDLQCEFQNVKNPGDLELYLRIRILLQFKFSAHGLNKKFGLCLECTAFKEHCFDSMIIEKDICCETKCSKEIGK